MKQWGPLILPPGGIGPAPFSLAQGEKVYFGSPPHVVYVGAALRPIRQGQSCQLDTAGGITPIPEIILP